MKKTVLITTLLVFILTACAASTTDNEQTSISLTATFTPIPTEVIQTQVNPATTDEIVQGPEPTETEVPQPGETQTFNIVPGESSVTYEVGEVFINQGNVFNLAVGVTEGLSGKIQIDYSNPQNSSIGPIQVDISEFTSDQARRDRAIRENWLESLRYPIATFVPTTVEGIPENGEEGVDYPIRITGEMTIREVTKEVTFDAAVKLENDVLSGTATTTLLMSDFGIGPIDILGILKTEDEVNLKLNFVARPSTEQQ